MMEQSYCGVRGREGGGKEGGREWGGKGERVGEGGREWGRKKGRGQDKRFVIWMPLAALLSAMCEVHGGGGSWWRGGAACPCMEMQPR